MAREEERRPKVKPGSYTYAKWDRGLHKIWHKCNWLTSNIAKPVGVDFQKNPALKNTPINEELGNLIVHNCVRLNGAREQI